VDLIVIQQMHKVTTKECYNHFSVMLLDIEVELLDIAEFWLVRGPKDLL